MSRRMITSAIALAMSLASSIPWHLDIRATADTDPHKPRPRSKGEKARNKRYRR